MRAKKIADNRAKKFPKVLLLLLRPSPIINKTPKRAINIETQTIFLGFSPIQNQLINPANIGDIERRNKVEAIDVFNIEKTYVKKAKQRKIPIRKSFLSSESKTKIGRLFLLRQATRSMIGEIPNDR